MIEERLAALVREAVATAGLGLDPEDVPEPEILAPKQKEHGDFATNVALALAKRAGRPPREVAAAILDALPVGGDLIERAEIAGPGFLNLFVRDDWLYDALRDVVTRGADYGRSPADGRRVQVEFVSANPTGPLTLGHARNAVIGDALARLLAFTGWTVEREYYFNDAGGQMDRFGASVEAQLPPARRPRGGGARGRLPRRVHRRARRRHPGDRGARDSPTSRPTSGSCDCARRARAAS